MRLFRLITLAFVFLLTLKTGMQAQPGWTYSLTSMNHSFLVQGVQMDGQPVAAGDYIGVFFQDGINRVCAGYIIWNGSMAALTAWADNPNTPQKDGFAASETIQWKVWHAANNEIYTAYPTYSSSFQTLGSFTAGGLSAVSLLQFSATPVVLPLNAAYSQINPTCNGSCNGTISVQVVDGTPPYGYYWSNGETSANIDSLCAGTYTVTISDQFVENTQPYFNWTFSTTSIVHLVSIPLNGIFLYQDTLINGIPQVLDTIQPQTGDYIGAFYNNNGTLACGGYLQWTGSGNSIQIYGDNGLTPTKEGFIPGELIQWKYWKNSEMMEIQMDDSVRYSNLFPQQGLWTSGGISALTHLAGRFVPLELPVVQDTVLTIVLSEPASLQVSFVLSDYNGYEVSHPDSADGSIQVSVSGGTPPFTFAWSNGSSLQNLLDVEAGNYSLTLSDANGCLFTSELIALESIPVISPLLIDYQLNNETCAGDCNGSIEIIASGGLEPYTFQWSNGATISSLNNLCPGNYTLTITDQSGLPSGEQILSLEVEGNQQLTLTADISDYNGFAVSSFGAADASIDLEIQGGIAPYSIVWSDGTSQPQLDSLSAGIYSLSISDQNNCELDTSFVLTQPAQIYTISANYETNNASCLNLCNGSIQVSPSGGIAPYYFTWSNAESSTTIDSLCAGTYSVTISDSNVPEGLGTPFNWQYSIGGPTQVILISAGTVRINEAVIQPGSYIGLFYQDNGVEKCGGYLQYFGSNTTLTARGDVPATPEKDGFTAGEPFIWKVWRIQDSVTVNVNPVYSLPLVNPGYFSSSGGLTILNSLKGTYIPPSNTQPLELNFLINEPLQLFGQTHLVAGISCVNESDAMIAVSANGGTPPYNFEWSNGSTADTLSNLGGAIYEVTITDFNSCTTVTSIGVDNPTALEVVYSLNHETCYNCQNGIINLAVSGGTQPYSYFWSNSSTLATQTNLGGGEYSISIQDANGCSYADTFTITTNPVQRIYLPASWSVFSIFVDHAFTDMAALTAPITNQIVIIKNTYGFAYMPAQNLNQLKSLDPDFGYQALLSSPANLYINGPVMNYSMQLIELPKHWSLLAYTRPVPGAVEIMLQDLQNELILLKSEQGNVYWPSMNLTDLNTMQPGKAYWIRLNNPASFTYPSN